MMWRAVPGRPWSGESSISTARLEWAKDRIIMGVERKSAVLTEESRKLTAYHEAGHAVVAMRTPGAMPVHKATIVPRGSALGMVTQLPDKDETSITRKQLLARLDVCMGGRVAEAGPAGPARQREEHVIGCHCTHDTRGQIACR